MKAANLVQELGQDQIELVVDYFLQADDSFLVGMGVEKNKLPARTDWIELIKADHQKPYAERSFFYLIWLAKGVAVGHSNINKIKYGKEAYMHLHLWPQVRRKQGMGSHFVSLSLPYYFDKFELEVLYCEPYAHNPAPNKTLPKVGFEFVKTYQPEPGWINFPQEANRYALTREKFAMIKSESPYPEKG